MENFLQHLLIRADKMTMAHSIEAREPFLDHLLVEFAFSLPTHTRKAYLHDKRVLRKAVKGIVPPRVSGRPKNRFFVPIHHWFNSEMGEYFWEIMDRPRLAIYKRSYLDQLRTRYDSSPLYYARQMWSILNLELWYETFFEAQETKEPMKIIVTS
jgi:asparagine synthase (glutamine-hydrolysing)